MESNNTTFDSMYSLNPWFSRLFPDFRELRPNELPEGADSGCQYTSVCINTAVYLPWLLGQCRKQGVVFRRGTVSHIRELRTMHHSGNKAHIIINTSGLGSARLGGVMDTLMSPIRGQTVLVENEAEPMYNISGTNDGPEEVSYLMTRAAGGGTVLGGTYNKGSWDTNPDSATSERIIKRCLALNPSLGNGKGREGVKIIRSGVGLRPWRKGGVRIESDLDTLKDGTLIVHNYGHAGWGYQGSYGCAERVVELVKRFLDTGNTKNVPAKL
jgi:D-amino-acid oxidase